MLFRVIRVINDSRIIKVLSIIKLHIGVEES